MPEPSSTGGEDVSRILHKEATLYTYLGEIDRKAAYAVSTMRNVYYRESAGITAGNTSPSDSLTLYVFDRQSKVTTFDGGDLSFHDDGTDIIVPGIHGAVENPLKLEGARKVMSVARFKAGTPRMWHWKVVAK
jgi:hypothetical protein